MPTKIFVGRLAEGTTSEEIGNLFGKFGRLTECDVISNYGFVHMESENEAKAAIAALDGFIMRGSRIHVEMSTASTQGRKRRGENVRDRDQLPPRRDSYAANPSHRSVPAAPPPAERFHLPPQEEFASDQVKDLLELYFRDPQAFDQYAKTYYYGERMERVRAYYDRRPPDPGAYPPATIRREEELGRGAAAYLRPVELSRPLRDDRGRSAMVLPASQTLYGSGRI